MGSAVWPWTEAVVYASYQAPPSLFFAVSLMRYAADGRHFNAALLRDRRRRRRRIYLSSYTKITITT